MEHLTIINHMFGPFSTAVGEFGIVYKAWLQQHSWTRVVAVKSLKGRIHRWICMMGPCKRYFVPPPPPPPHKHTLYCVLPCLVACVSASAVSHRYLPIMTRVHVASLLCNPNHQECCAAEFSL